MGEKRGGGKNNGRSRPRVGGVGKVRGEIKLSHVPLQPQLAHLLLLLVDPANTICSPIVLRPMPPPVAVSATPLVFSLRSATRSACAQHSMDWYQALAAGGLGDFQRRVSRRLAVMRPKSIYLDVTLYFLGRRHNPSMQDSHVQSRVRPVH